MDAQGDVHAGRDMHQRDQRSPVRPVDEDRIGTTEGRGELVVDWLLTHGLPEALLDRLGAHS